MKIVKAIRGAITCDNTKESITDNVCLMCNEIIQQNNLTAADIISIQFSITKDLTVLNPATALRKGNMRIDVSDIALFCTQEAYIDGGIPFVVRVLVHTYMDQFANKKNVYLNGAEKLRPDYSGK
ncbi:MAG: chorismate mutase [Treponema sp.]|nr:chorismate mutase [Treponema sp.]